MKKGEQLTINNAKVGQKIKIAITRTWAQTPYHKPYSRGNYCWVKGRITNVYDKSIIISTRYKYYKRCIHSFVHHLFCVADKDGKFNKMYMQLKLK